MPDHPAECIELLRNLSGDSSPSFEQVAKAAVAGLDRIVGQNSEPDGFPQLRALTAGLQRQRGLAPDSLVNLFSALRAFRAKLLIDAAEKIGSRLEVFPPTSMVVPAIERMCVDWGDMPPAVDRAVRHLWTSAARLLLLHSEVPPQPPSDWRLTAKLSCTCADCRELLGFALDPVERVHRFRVRKERRRHLHQVIDRHALDMTHVTERAGSPQTLVCTKDRRTFSARMKEYQSEVAAMRKLVKLTPQTAVAGGFRKRIAAAIKASTI